MSRFARGHQGRFRDPIFLCQHLAGSQRGFNRSLPRAGDVCGVASGDVSIVTERADAVAFDSLCCVYEHIRCNYTIIFITHLRLSGSATPWCFTTKANFVVLYESANASAHTSHHGCLIPSRGLFVSRVSSFYSRRSGSTSVPTDAVTSTTTTNRLPLTSVPPQWTQSWVAYFMLTMFPPAKKKGPGFDFLNRIISPTGASFSTVQKLARICFESFLLYLRKVYFRNDFHFPKFCSA